MARLKITHIITGLNTGGAEWMLYKLISGIDKQQFDCQIISLTTLGTMGEKFKALGVNVISLGMKNARPDPIGFYRLIRLLKQQSPDLVQTWLYHADLLGGLAAKLTGIAVVWNIRHSNLDTKLNKRHTLWTVKLCAKFSPHIPKAILCNSQRAIQIHQQVGYKKSLFYFIGNGFDLEQYQPNPSAKISLCHQLGLTKAAKIVGLVARFDSQKNHQGFIKAAEHIIKQRNDVYFALIGKGVDESNSQLMQWIRQTDNEEHFFLFGERSDIARLTAGFTVACSSSFGEGFPNSIGEAMACGVPCVVTDVGDCAYLVGDAGSVVPVDDNHAFSQAILKILELPPQEYQQLSQRARQRIQHNFSITKIIDQYQQFYQRLTLK